MIVPFIRKARKLAKQILHNLEDLGVDSGLMFQQYQQTLFSRSVRRNLIETFSADEGQYINTSQFFLGFGLLHYALIRNTKPKAVLCIGSRKGFIPALLALGCKDNGVGHVDFVDPGYDIQDKGKNWSGIGFWKTHDSYKHFKTMCISSWITTFVMTTEEFTKKYLSKTYDYIYIDGDHSYAGVKKDFTLLWPRLHDHGLMVFHDIVAKGYLDGGKFGVWKFWKELQVKEKLSFRFPKSSGLGIIQKTKHGKIS